MAKYTTRTAEDTSLIRTTGEKTPTHEGGVGWVRNAKSELFITAVSTMIEPTFYEKVEAREARLVTLVRIVAIEDPDWMLRFMKWLRAVANMRSVAVLVAVEFVKARLDAGLTGSNRSAIYSVCKRADEPGQVLAYWISRYGRKIPAPVKRGVADAAELLYSERAVLRYDGQSEGFRLGDVLNLTHPKPLTARQEALFGYLLDKRHGSKVTTTALIGMLPPIAARTRLNAMPIEARHIYARKVLDGDTGAEAEFNLALAGQWEWAKSWLGQDAEDTTFSRVTDAEQWEMLIPQMGTMALARNLRNFDTAGISAEMQTWVKGRFLDRAEIERSKMFPFRWYSAFKATGGNHWEPALSAALEHSLSNVPALTGRSLILVDMSGSMFYGNSGRSSITLAEQAALFGTALALRADSTTLVKFGSDSHQVVVDPAKSVLQHMAQFTDLGGTRTAAAVREWYRPGEHDRVIIVTDEQAHFDPWGDGSVDETVPAEVPLFTWNLGGHAAAHVESAANRHTFAGLTDQAWALVPLVESGAREEWPF